MSKLLIRYRYYQWVCRAALGNKKNARPRRFSETVIDLVRAAGIEPAAPAWKAGILAVIRRSLIYFCN